jgi:plastocyanin
MTNEEERMRVRRAWVVFGLLAMLGAAACSSDDGTGGSTTSAPGTSASGDDGGSADAVITARDFEFDPATATIPSGGTIEITNEGPSTHSFTMDDDSVTEDIEPGASVTVTVTTAGGFHCRFHSQMTGTVEFA